MRWEHLGGIAIALACLAAEPPAVTVEPSDLVRRADLIGRTITVDDRVRLYQLHPGRGYDELYLKRTPVVFRIPPPLRPETPSSKPGVRVQGVLTREGEHWYCDVIALEPQPKDLARLEAGVAALPPDDFQGRVAWARWAERRGTEFSDQALLDRARSVETEAIQLEADRPSADPAAHWLALSKRARDRHLAEPEPSALAHRALRARLDASKSPADLKSVRAQIEALLPDAGKVPGNAGALSKWDAAYRRDPAGAYRMAPPEARRALDHRLWEDATQRLFEAEARDDPRRALELSEQAASALPDRPEVATRLLESGLNASTRDLAKLRQRDVEALAKVYRERLRQPEKARALLRDWLNDQRLHRIRSSDAEGRLALATQYESLLGDRTTAVDLLREALAIDPESKDVTDALRRRGFRKVNDEWVEPTGRDGATAVAEETQARSERNLSLKDCTPQEVRTRLGANPSRIVRSASQGEVIEQWVYFGDNQTSYINFRYGPGQTRPTVISYYALPKNHRALRR